MGCVPSKSSKAPVVALQPYCVLILGAAGSGKSTLTKQLRLFHGVTFTPDEINLFRTAFIANIYLAVYDLIKYAEKSGHDVATPAARKFFVELDPYAEPFNADSATLIKQILLDSSVKAIRRKMPRNPYLEVLAYAEDKLDEIDSRTWTPSVEDVLHARCTTSGVTVTKFTTPTEEWTLIDVGGQPGQRKKWSSAVPQDTTLSAVFFFVAADEYDVPCEEAPGKTKIQTSIKIWQEALAPGGVTSNVPVVLVLNRIDMLAKKLQEDDGESFKEAFPSFKRDDDREDLEVALDVLKDAYLDKTSANSKQSIYVQRTCALDGDNIKNMFNTVRSNLQRFKA